MKKAHVENIPIYREVEKAIVQRVKTGLMDFEISDLDLSIPSKTAREGVYYLVRHRGVRVISRGVYQFQKPVFTTHGLVLKEKPKTLPQHSQRAGYWGHSLG